MGCCKYTLAIAALISAFMGYKIYSALFHRPDIPNLPRDQWWGPGEPSKTPDTSIRPMIVEFNDEMIEDLRDRLNRVRHRVNPLEGIAFQYGFNNDHLDSIIDYWKTRYNFTDRAALLNRYPHFLTNIQGLDLHYIHVKPKVRSSNMKVYPLMLLHGWPGTFVEFQKIINLLIVPREGYDFVFELIIPSLPGYGYSQGASKKGLGTPQVAIVMKNLMDRLGFKKFIVQGGDWGAIIGSHISILYPDSVIGHHTNMPVSMSPIANIVTFVGGLFPSLVAEKEHHYKIYPLSNVLSNLLEETGYFHLQTTKPDTVGVGLQDSPVGLAAYIIEKFSTWTDKEYKNLKDGGLTKKFSLDELLDNIMIYWSSHSITTSMRLYAETMNKAQLSLQMDSIPVHVPTAVIRCNNELVFAPDCLLKDRYKQLVSISDKKCGHFLAMEEPQILADDLWSTVPKFENYYKSNEKNNEL